jgi:hypothetical protein
MRFSFETSCSLIVNTSVAEPEPLGSMRDSAQTRLVQITKCYVRLGT